MIESCASSDEAVRVLTTGATSPWRNPRVTPAPQLPTSGADSVSGSMRSRHRRTFTST